VPDTAARPRRTPPTTWELLRHRAAVPVVRARLWLPRPRRVPARAAPKVTILLVHAWGMGGTIRTMLEVAGWLARRYEVEILSVWRTREKPFFPFPPDVTVVAADDRRRGAGGRPARVLRRVPGCLLYPGDRTARRMTLWSDVQLVRRLRASRPDVLIGTRPALNLLVARAGGAPALVASEHTPFAAYRGCIQREILRRYGRLDAVVVLGEGQRAPLGQTVRDASRVRVIPNSAPRPRIEARPALDSPVVVSTGRLVPAKGYDRLIRAFTWVAEAHPEWRLRICGGGEDRAALDALVAELRLGDRVELLGRVRDVEAALAQASVFALASRVEGLPVALLEAMATGLAVVSFDSGACQVIEHGVDGLLVPAGDEPGLARAICALIESAPLRRRLGAAAQRKAAAYGIELVGPRWDALVEELT
jgi:glycosyltransferase involved in cell wall biosynthesis